MNVLVTYFSQSGNTEKIAKAIYEEAAQNNTADLKKLEENGYIKIEKKFINRKPLTTCHLTQQGSQSFAEYISTVESFIKKTKNKDSGGDSWKSMQYT